MKNTKRVHGSCFLVFEVIINEREPTSLTSMITALHGFNDGFEVFGIRLCFDAKRFFIQLI